MARHGVGQKGKLVCAFCAIIESGVGYTAALHRVILGEMRIIFVGSPTGSTSPKCVCSVSEPGHAQYLRVVYVWLAPLQVPVLWSTLFPSKLI